MEETLLTDGEDALLLNNPHQADLEELEKEMDRTELEDDTFLLQGLEKECAAEEVSNIIRELCKATVLPEGEILELFKAMEHGDAPHARQKVILGNQRLVVWAAKRFQKLGMDILDLISEGNVGLHKAADKFDYRRGTKFSTFAAWYVRGAIMDSLATSIRVIRIPEDVILQFYKLSNAENHLLHTQGTTGSISQLAKETGFSQRLVKELLEFRKHPQSIDLALSNHDSGPYDKNATLGDGITDRNMRSNDANLQADDITQKIRLELEALTNVPSECKETYALAKGLYGNREYSVKEVSALRKIHAQTVKNHIALVQRALKRTTVASLVES